jgi:uncharacterized protein
MLFPISGEHIDPFYLMAIGFIVGILGGFFGVGGSFLAGPALFAVGVPMNFVVGTDLAHIVGKSIVAARRHRILGNVDMKLGVVMVAGTIAGVESGAQLIEFLKRRMQIDWIVGTCFVVILMAISLFMAWESWKTIRQKRSKNQAALARGATKDLLGKRKADESALGHIAKRIQRIRIPPMISLPASGIDRISVWVILLVAYVGGAFSGFLGGGAGYIRMPSMVYLLGFPPMWPWAPICSRS